MNIWLQPLLYQVLGTYFKLNVNSIREIQTDIENWLYKRMDTLSISKKGREMKLPVRRTFGPFHFDTLLPFVFENVGSYLFCPDVIS